MLTIGDSAPLDITVKSANTKITSLRDFLGSYVVLYFYPKDDTPGCTLEACNFRDNTTPLKELGVEVIGISADSTKSHQSFAEKHTLPFPLLSDPKRELITAFGALEEKSMFGKKYQGIERCTFALDPSGKIIHAWRRVNPLLNHSEEVLTFFRNKLKRN